MSDGRYEKEEYLEQDEDERQRRARLKSVIALMVMALLVIVGVLLVGRLRGVSLVQDCMMTQAANCNDIVSPPRPAGIR